MRLCMNWDTKILFWGFNFFGKVLINIKTIQVVSKFLYFLCPKVNILWIIADSGEEKQNADGSLKFPVESQLLADQPLTRPVREAKKTEREAKKTKKSKKSKKSKKTKKSKESKYNYKFIAFMVVCSCLILYFVKRRCRAVRT